MLFAALGAATMLLSASAQDAAKRPIVSPHARLMAARSIFIEHVGGRLPNDVIGDAFQGWGHYIVVNDPVQADLIVAINAPVSVVQIRLTILDGHDRVVLWSDGEKPKSSLKERSREDFVVEASLRLFRRFRDTIEPEPAP